MTTYILLNDTTSAATASTITTAGAPPPSTVVVNASDVMTTPSSPSHVTGAGSNVTDSMWEAGGVVGGVGAGGGGCGEDGGACNVTGSTQVEVNLALCRRLAPPPVPPWLRDSPARLQELTRHCKSWTLYHELCNTGSGNTTWNNPRHGETTDDEVKEAPGGIQWAIPSMALVVVVLVLVLALVLYKYYSRPNKKRMYRVAGSAYRFKPPQTSTSWAGRGALVESETAESYLSQHPPAGAAAAAAAEAGAGPDFRFARSPVCRLLEQTQYVATPTEDQHRPRPVGPPAFASPAYFLPALSWLRLPLLRQAWPGENKGTTGAGAGAGDSALYNAARPLQQCDCEETTHHWPADAQWVESRPEEEPEYSEIFDGPPQYADLNNVHSTHPAPNGIGPYEYEMQETANGHASCDCSRARHYHHHHHHLPQHRSRSNGHFGRNEHRYEKLWHCSEGESSDLAPDQCSSAPGTCENGWLSRYRLPSPCVPNTSTDPSRGRRDRLSHAHNQDGGVKADDLTSDSELLPCECPFGGSLSVVPSDWDFANSSNQGRRTDDRTEVKYSNPVFEGHGDVAPPRSGSSPLLNRLWGYMGWHRR